MRHDPPVLRRLHPGQHRVGAGKDAEEVDRGHPLPLARVGVGEEAELVRARVVDEDRERAVLGDEVDRRLRIGHVERRRLGADLSRERAERRRR